MLLDSWTQSILFYGLDGSFVKRVKLDTSPSDFVRLEDNNYVFSRSGEVDSLAGIYLVDAMGKFTSKLIARDDKYLFNNFSDNWELSVFDGIVGFNGSLSGEYSISLPIWQIDKSLSDSYRAKTYRKL